MFISKNNSNHCPSLWIDSVLFIEEIWSPIIVNSHEQFSATSDQRRLNFCGVVQWMFMRLNSLVKNDCIRIGWDLIRVVFVNLKLSFSWRMNNSISDMRWVLISKWQISLNVYGSFRICPIVAGGESIGLFWQFKSWRRAKHEISYMKSLSAM